MTPPGKDHLEVTLVPGVPPVLDRLAEGAPPSLRFLRAAWFCRGEPAALSTLVARRRGGVEIIALPLRQAGPPILGVRALAGSYWPFRSAALAQDVTVVDVLALLDDPVTLRAIGPVLRLGPVYGSDRLARLMSEAARIKGWGVLCREMGQSFIQDLPCSSDIDAWPSKSRRRKLRRLCARLEQTGPVTVRIVRGADWSRQVFRDLARIEELSWVGTRTDRSGAKFINPDMLAHWQRAVVDPEIADMLAASILYVGDRPVAFSLDLITGALQYGIASSYDEAFAACSPGQIVTVHAIDDSIARGVRSIDWGAGDSGYKQQIGARPGEAILDFLIVRSPALAATLRPKWEGGTGSGASALVSDLAAGPAIVPAIGPAG